MANPEHLAILKQGVEVWNKWRDENKYQYVRPDLRGANLIRANLFSADLSEANLFSADLSEANLGSANLIRANLCGATKLSGANLDGANLSDANLFSTYLSKANLSRANLSGADLRGANLNGANLSDANLGGADLRGADLSFANLIGADLETSQVIGVNFYNAILTGACIQNWYINNTTNRVICERTTKLDGVICDYVYLHRTKTERRPINGNFAPGEFASLYKKIIETTDLILRKTPENENTVNKPENIDVDNTSNNQGIQFYSNSTIHTWENLRFRSKTEIKIAEALDRTGVLFVPNSLARLTTPKGRENKEADFLICYNGKWGVLEVDGPFHTA